MGRDQGNGRYQLVRRGGLRYGDGNEWTTPVFVAEAPPRTVARGPMSPAQIHFAEQNALAREAGMMIEQRPVYGDARGQHYGIGPVTIADGDTTTTSFQAGFTLQIVGFLCPSTQAPGLILEDVQAARKSQMLSSGGVAMEAYTEVSLVGFVGDWLERGTEVSVTISNFSGDDIVLRGSALICNVAR